MVTQWLADVSRLAVLLRVCDLIVRRPSGYFMGTPFGYLTAGLTNMCALGTGEAAALPDDC